MMDSAPSSVIDILSTDDQEAFAKALLASESTPFKQRTKLYMAVIVLILGLVFYLLGLAIMQQFRDAQSRTAARANAIYVQGILEPYVGAMATDGNLTAANRKQINEVLAQTSLGKHLIAMVIWDLQGRVVFSSLVYRTEFVLETKEFQAALSGNLGVELVHEDDKTEVVDVPVPFFEIYVPLYGDSSAAPVAVAEVYWDATDMLAQQAAAQLSVWLSLGFAMYVLAGLSSMTVLLRSRFLGQLQVAQRLTTLNQSLRQAAVRERIAATQSNEALLNILGAEIHDGPVQMLSLLMLTLEKDTVAVTSSGKINNRKLAEGILEDLRAISGGLILPEIQNLSLSNALSLAVCRHEEMSGAKIGTNFAALPKKVDAGLAICLYRFVQEGLANSHRYAGADDISVIATLSGKQLGITVSDHGETSGGQKTVLPTHRGLGLQGIRNRLAIYGGTIRLSNNQFGGKDLSLTVELAPDRRRLSN